MHHIMEGRKRGRQKVKPIKLHCNTCFNLFFKILVLHIRSPFFSTINNKIDFGL